MVLEDFVCYLTDQTKPATKGGDVEAGTEPARQQRWQQGGQAASGPSGLSGAADRDEKPPPAKKRKTTESAHHNYRGHLAKYLKTKELPSGYSFPADRDGTRQVLRLFIRGMLGTCIFLCVAFSFSVLTVPFSG